MTMTSDGKPASLQAGSPLVLPGFDLYARRDLVRMRRPFVQALLFANSRAQRLDVVPMFYVVGAHPADAALFQTMSVPLADATGDLRWLFPANAPVEDEVAQRLLAHVEGRSPLSFVAPLDDEAICKALELLAAESCHWLPALSKAFVTMCMGSSAAVEDLAHARHTFMRFSNVGQGGTPRAFERVLMDRFDELERRLQRFDCVIQCREEAEEHAVRLGLPPIAWPAEWSACLDVGDAVKNRWLAALLGRRPGVSSRGRTGRSDAPSERGKREDVRKLSEKLTGR